MNNRTIRSIRLRRGLQSELMSITLRAGEPGWTEDTKRLYIGDGSIAGGILIGDVVNTEVIGPILTTYRKDQDLVLRFTADSDDERFAFLDMGVAGQPYSNTRLDAPSEQAERFMQTTPFTASDYKEIRFHIIDRVLRADPDGDYSHIRNELRDDTVRTLEIFPTDFVQEVDFSDWSADRHGAGNFADIRRFSNLKSFQASNLGLHFLYTDRHTPMETLRVSGNNLPGLDTTGMPNLRTLLARRNQIKGISLFNNAAVQVVDLAFNDLVAFSFEGLDNLVEADISHNAIGNPLELIEFDTLVDLRAAFNEIPSMNLDGSDKITYLDIRNNEITSLGPNNLSDASLLETFRAANNLLGDGSVNWNNLAALKHVDVRNNLFTSLIFNPAFQTVSTVKAGGPDLSWLEVTGQDDLVLIHLEQAPILTTVVGLDDITGLKEFTARFTGLNVIDLSDRENLAKLVVTDNSNLETLLVARSGLSSFISGEGETDEIIIARNGDLQTLDLSENDLGVVEIRSNGNLRNLFLQDNPRLAAIGNNGLVTNPTLEHVNVSNTQLATLVPQGQELYGFGRLSVYDNLPALEHLDIRNTRIPRVVLYDSVTNTSQTSLLSLFAGGSADGNTRNDFLQEINARGVGTLAELWVKHTDRLTRLEAPDCALSGNDTHIADNTALEYVDLSGNTALSGTFDFSHPGSGPAPALRHLDMSDTLATIININSQDKLTWEGLMLPTSLQRLFAAGAAALAGDMDFDGFNNLIEVDLSGTRVSTVSGSLPVLSSVDLSDNIHLFSVDFSGSQNLSTLRLGNTPSLAYLDVSRSTPAPAIPLDILDSSQIEHLDLQNYGATDLLLHANAGANLVYADIRGTGFPQFSIVGANKLTTFMVENSAVEFLRLEGATQLSGAINLTGLTELDEITLQDNPDITSLTNFPANHYESIILSGMPGLTGSLSALSSKWVNITGTAITQLSFTATGANVDYLSQGLFLPPTLTSLTIAHAGNGLTFLDVEDTALTTANVVYRGALKVLRTGGRPISVVNNLLPGSPNSVLEELSLRGTNINGQNLTISGYSALKALDLSDLSDSAGSGSLTLNDLAIIEELKLSGIPTVTISSLPSLVLVEVGAGMSTLNISNSPNLEELGAVGSDLSTLDLTLAGWTPNANGLKRLYLRDNSILTNLTLSATIEKLTIVNSPVHAYANGFTSAFTPFVTASDLQYLNVELAPDTTWQSALSYGVSLTASQVVANRDIRLRRVNVGRTVNSGSPDTPIMTQDFANSVRTLNLTETQLVTRNSDNAAPGNRSAGDIDLFPSGRTWDSLQHIALSAVPLASGTPGLDPDAYTGLFQAGASRFPALRSIRMKNTGWDGTATGVTINVSLLPELQTLKVGPLVGHTLDIQANDTMKNIFVDGGPSDEGPRTVRVRNSSPAIDMIAVRGGTQVGDGRIMLLPSDAGGSPVNYPACETLDLTRAKVDVDISRFTGLVELYVGGSTVENITLTNTPLASLNFTETEWEVMDEDATYIHWNPLGGAKLPALDLKVISVQNAPGLLDIGFAELASLAPILETLHLEGTGINGTVVVDGGPTLEDIRLLDNDALRGVVLRNNLAGLNRLEITSSTGDPIVLSTTGVTNSPEELASYVLRNVSIETVLPVTANAYAAIDFRDSPSLPLPDIASLAPVGGVTELQYVGVDVRGRSSVTRTGSSAFPLRTLHLENVDLLTSVDVRSISTPIVGFLQFSDNPILQTVSLRAHASLPTSHASGDYSILQVHGNPNLQTIDIQGLNFIEGFTQTGTGWDQLRTFILDGTDLPEFTLSDVRRLTKLVVRGNTNLMSVDLRNLGELATSPGMELDLSGSYNGNEPTRLSFANNRIAKLNLSGCKLAGTLDLSGLEWRWLQELDISNNPNLERVRLPSGLRRLYASNSNRNGELDLGEHQTLEVLDVSNNPGLTDLENLPAKLHTLNVSNSGVRRVMLMNPSQLEVFLHDGANDLHTINLSGGTKLPNLDVSGLGARPGMVGGLQNLNVGNNDWVTDIISTGTAGAGKVRILGGLRSVLTGIAAPNASGLTEVHLGQQFKLTHIRFDNCQNLTTLTWDPAGSGGSLDSVINVDLRDTNLPLSTLTALMERLFATGNRNGTLRILGIPSLPATPAAFTAASAFATAYTALKNGRGWTIDYSSGNVVPSVKVPLRLVHSAILNTDGRWSHSGMRDYVLNFHRAAGTRNIQVGVHCTRIKSRPIYITNTVGGLPNLNPPSMVPRPTSNVAVDRDLILTSVTLRRIQPQASSVFPAQEVNVINDTSQISQAAYSSDGGGKIIGNLAQFTLLNEVPNSLYRVSMTFLDYSGELPAGQGVQKQSVTAAGYNALSTTAAKSKVIRVEATVLINTPTTLVGNALNIQFANAVPAMNNTLSSDSQSILIGETLGTDLAKARLPIPEFEKFEVRTTTRGNQYGISLDYDVRVRPVVPGPNYPEFNATPGDYVVEMAFPVADGGDVFRGDRNLLTDLSNLYWWELPVTQTTTRYIHRRYSSSMLEAGSRQLPQQTVFVRVRDRKGRYLPSHLYYGPLPIPTEITQVASKSGEPMWRQYMEGINSMAPMLVVNLTTAGGNWGFANGNTAT